MMRKILSICGIGMLTLSILGACLLLGGGEEKNKVRLAALYHVKQTENEGKQVFVMNEKTAQILIKTGIITESDNKEEITDSEHIFSLPTIKDNEALLFARSNSKNIKTVELNGIKINTKFEKNAWLRRRDNRDKKIDELLLIVNNDTFKKILPLPTYMDIIELDNKEYHIFLKNMPNDENDKFITGVSIKNII